MRFAVLVCALLGGQVLAGYPVKEDTDFFLEMDDTNNDENQAGVEEQDPRFQKFSETLNLAPPKPKPGCDFCLEMNQCKRWDEACAIKHPECSVKCGKLPTVPGPACLTCIEKAGCREWDTVCNEKAPHCHLFCECGKFHNCADCTKLTQCSWCAFKDHKTDNMGQCRYASDAGMAQCSAPAFFAKFDFQCVAAVRVQHGLSAEPKHPVVAHSHSIAPPSVTSSSFTPLPASAVHTVGGTHHIKTISEGVNLAPEKRKYNDLVGVNFAPPPVSTKSTIEDPHHIFHKHHKKAAAVASLARMAKRAELAEKVSAGFTSYGQN